MGASPLIRRQSAQVAAQGQLCRIQFMSRVRYGLVDFAQPAGAP